MRNKEEGRKEGRGEDRGKGRGASPFFFTLTFPLFLTSKNLPVRRNYSPPLNRTALLHHWFLPTSPLPLQPPTWPHLLIASKQNSLVNGVLRALYSNSAAFIADAFRVWILLCMPVAFSFWLWKQRFLHSSTFTLGFCLNFPPSESTQTFGNYWDPRRLTWWRPRPVKPSKGP